MIENKFTTTSIIDAMKFIQMHLEQGFVVSAVSKDNLPVTNIGDLHILSYSAKKEYLILATKEE